MFLTLIDFCPALASSLIKSTSKIKVLAHGGQNDSGFPSGANETISVDSDKTLLKNSCFLADFKGYGLDVDESLPVINA